MKKRSINYFHQKNTSPFFVLKSNHRRLTMFHTTLMETEDRSYYTDKLEHLTGIPRRDWSRLTFEDLKEHFERVVKRENEKLFS